MPPPPLFHFSMTVPATVYHAFLYLISTNVGIGGQLVRASRLLEKQSDLLGRPDPPAWEIPAQGALPLLAQQQGCSCDEDHHRHLWHHHSIL